MTIYKLQKPIVTNDPNRSWKLDTKKGKTYLIPEDMVPDKLARMMGRRHKIFVEMTMNVDENGTMNISRLKRTHWRDW